MGLAGEFACWVIGGFQDVHEPCTALVDIGQRLALRGDAGRPVRARPGVGPGQLLGDGKGAYVRPATELARNTDTRTVNRTGQTFTDTTTADWTEVEKPTTYREDASAERSRNCSACQPEPCCSAATDC